ncbi:hypothetical protein L210DRAFT_3658826 [Boletus edulis BED1]|uniref:Uncharacterized protein n=1 Tax=Boletus edulis BED1 TaxID=1328754 RepID=A0AAD4B9H4_BOLED|nr:hypothetical protein L210DRAFT_3658826 [Boletus edulis BED1]
MALKPAVSLRPAKKSNFQAPTRLPILVSSPPTVYNPGFKYTFPGPPVANF